MIFLFLRKRTPRTRAIIGVALLTIGVALVALSTGFLIHGIILSVIGGIVLVNGLRQAKAAS
jgi:drug/metabolite transporter (DMT)-like permease